MYACIVVEFTRTLTDIRVTSYNEKAMFTCVSTTESKPIWRKDGLELKIDNSSSSSSSRIETDSDERTHRLIINDINSQDDGVYTAVYKQCPHKEVTTSAVLHVLRKFCVY